MAPYAYIVFKVVRGFGEILHDQRLGDKARAFLVLRVSLLRSWWACLRKRCDYFKIYQAYGPAEMTHVGYHSAEQLALEHRANCSTRTYGECETCHGWADRLRGEVWQVLMTSKAQTAKTEKHYGFHPTGAHEE